MALDLLVSGRGKAGETGGRCLGKKREEKTGAGKRKRKRERKSVSGEGRT
jgi:hypothetical protein